MNNNERTFYTVPEAAGVLRVDPATIYRAIRDDAFPAVRLRSRCVIPVAAIDELVEAAARTGTCIDVAAMARQRRSIRELRAVTAGGSVNRGTG